MRIIGRDVVHRDAEITVVHLAVLDQVRRDRMRDLRGDGKAGAGELAAIDDDGAVDADQLPVGIDQRPARVAWVHRGVGLDVRTRPAGVIGVGIRAIHRAHDAACHRKPQRGLVFAKRPAQLKAAMADVLENADADLTPMMWNLINSLWSEWKTMEQQIDELGDELERISSADAGCTRIRQIPVIGPVVATAIVAAIGNGAAFRKGREFAAWLGIVPRQYSTGGKTNLLGISKRGNVYLRKILIHGARAAVLRIRRDRVPIGAWLDRLDARAHKNVVVVATANKLARTAWAVLSSGNDYRPTAIPA